MHLFPTKNKKTNLESHIKIKISDFSKILRKNLGGGMSLIIKKALKKKKKKPERILFSNAKQGTFLFLLIITILYLDLKFI